MLHNVIMDGPLLGRNTTQNARRAMNIRCLTVSLGDWCWLKTEGEKNSKARELNVILTDNFHLSVSKYQQPVELLKFLMLAFHAAMFRVQFFCFPFVFKRFAIAGFQHTALVFTSIISLIHFPSLQQNPKVLISLGPRKAIILLLVVINVGSNCCYLKSNNIKKRKEKKGGLCWWACRAASDTKVKHCQVALVRCHILLEEEVSEWSSTEVTHDNNDFEWYAIIMNACPLSIQVDYFLEVVIIDFNAEMSQWPHTFQW